MTSSDQEKQTTPTIPKHDLNRLRSASPAVKRPASVMGAQDREEHTSDVEMANATAPRLVVSEPQSSDHKAKQQDTGKTHAERDAGSDVPHASHPGAVQHNAPSDSTGTSLSDSLMPTSASHSTSATSIVTPELQPTCENLPSFDEQHDRVKEGLEKEKKVGQKGFIISTKWFNRIEARRSRTAASVDKDAAEGEVGPIDNANLAMVTEDTGKLYDLAGEKFVMLRPGLRYEEEYLVVPEDTWDALISWYGLARNSPVITRYAYETSEADAIMPTIDYELDPPIFTFLKVVGEHTPQTQREVSLAPPKMVASKYMPAVEWLRRAKMLVNVDIATKVRVWRILGGLKSHAPSGLPSPVASRSSSPAPGSELVASIPDKMLLDFNSLAALPVGEHREDLSMDDNTANEKYNGSSKLGMYAGKSELIAIEEQRKNGEWPSDSSRLILPKNLKDKAKAITSSGRTSPAPGIMTRGRTQREGKTRGNVGLTNLGNTCYMNSALQSIRSVRELTEYFLHDRWKPEVNKENILGYGGQIAKAYGNLIKAIFDQTGGAYSPRDFKSAVGRHNSNFQGYGQQDSQEFLLFLLDGLAEDLNRIHKKPYIEKPDSTDEMVHDHAALKAFADKNWADYKARNDSVITDLFAGMYKSTLTCPKCQKVSIIFDPFNNLTLQLPIESTWSKFCHFLPLHGRPVEIEVEVDKHASIQVLKEFVSKRVKVPSSRLIVTEAYKHKFYKIFDNPVILSEANISANDVIFIFELEDVPTNYNPNKRQAYSLYGSSNTSDEVVDSASPGADKLLVPIFHRLVKYPDDRKRSQRPFFGYPSFIVLDRNDNQSYNAIQRKILGNVVSMTTRKLLDEVEDDEDGSDAVVVNDDSSRSATTTNEDGFIDVPMRDTSLAPESTDATSARLERFLSSGGPVPPMLDNLYEIRVKATGEGVPTGWNQISEHDDFASIRARLPKVNKSKQKRRGSEDSRSAESDATSEDTGDIAHDASSPESDAASAGSEDTPMASTEDVEADDDAHTASLFPNFKAANRQKHSQQKVYRRKGKNIQGRRVQQRREPVRVRQQPTPPESDVDMLVQPGECIVLDWNLGAFDALFEAGNDEQDDRGAATWRGDLPRLEDPELQQKRQVRKARKRNGVSLLDCLDEFGKTETLSEQNMWYCPRCKEHRRADKKWELWKAPDILVMHLKRFSSQRNFRDKLELMVDYPVEGLDMTAYVQDPQEGESLIYDLIAVDNHYGGLGGGHYTAYAKSFNDENWHEYNGKWPGHCFDFLATDTSRWTCLTTRSTSSRDSIGIHIVLPSSF
jgi:ubiquitin carboxyl-terminal hydrolase 4/11